MTPTQLLWTGRTIIGLLVAFLLFDAVTKILMLAPVVLVTEKLGVPTSTVRGIGVTLLVCTVLYAVPQTSILSAILLTGYLGGAVATHVRAESGVFPVVFRSAFGVLMWGGLVLCDPRLFKLILR